MTPEELERYREVERHAKRILRNYLDAGVDYFVIEEDPEVAGRDYEFHEAIEDEINRLIKDIIL